MNMKFNDMRQPYIEVRIYKIGIGCLLWHKGIQDDMSFQTIAEIDIVQLHLT